MPPLPEVDALTTLLPLAPVTEPVVTMMLPSTLLARMPLPPSPVTSPPAAVFTVTVPEPAADALMPVPPVTAAPVVTLTLPLPPLWDALMPVPEIAAVIAPLACTVTPPPALVDATNPETVPLPVTVPVPIY